MRSSIICGILHVNDMSQNILFIGGMLWLSAMDSSHLHLTSSGFHRGACAMSAPKPIVLVLLLEDDF